MLRACNRVLKPGGLLAFLVIAEGQTATRTNRVRHAGPEYVATDEGYPDMLKTAGFDDIGLIDVTAEYRVTLAAWISEWDAEAQALGQLLGDKEFTERQRRRRHALAAIDNGLLRRYLLTARRP